MKKNLNGKIATIVGVLLVCLYGIFGIPHGVTGTALLSAITQRIHLGLDLQGGAHLILQVVVKDAVNAETDNTLARLQQDLAGLPQLLARVEQLGADGVIGGEQPNAADLQIGATMRVLLTVEDLQPLLRGGVGERIAQSLFPEYQGAVPAGAYPAGWVPSP